VVSGGALRVDVKAGPFDASGGVPFTPDVSKTA